MKRVTGIGGIFFKSTEPKKLQNWYVEHLGLKIVRSGDAPAHARFLADSEGESIILKCIRLKQ